MGYIDPCRSINQKLDNFRHLAAVADAFGRLALNGSWLATARQLMLTGRRRSLVVGDREGMDMRLIQAVG